MGDRQSFRSGWAQHRQNHEATRMLHPVAIDLPLFRMNTGSYAFHWHLETGQ